LAELDQDAVLTRAKAMAAEAGYTWKLDFSVPSQQRASLRGQRFLSEDRRQEYLQRARKQLEREAGDPL
jgi:hypothetical protein